MADKGRSNIANLSYNRRSLDGKKSRLIFDNFTEHNNAIDENTKWLNTNEAAELLKLTPNALRILVHRAQVKCFKFGRRLRFRPCDLMSLLQPKEK
jgi:hypothetical protein